ncbi:MAG: transglutaminase domain-containing protein [Prevotella sp.]|jgi:hypothetical protein|nr:transglutaminase domain-containing protein [Prevotella sp.]MCH3995314.1 transglutaminase domain-containing protein [Prevotella sp.]
MVSACLVSTLLPAANYHWESDLHHRLLYDFSKTREEVKTYIRQYIPDVSDQQMDNWEKTGALEARIIDGKKLYFHNAASNLFLIDPSCRKIKESKDGIAKNGYETVDQTNVPLIIREAPHHPLHLAEPKHMRITYTITVNADAVPEGEIVRCWMPFPRRDIQRQRDVKLINASEKSYILSPENSAHSSLYMEKKAVKGEPTVFSETFEFTSFGSWFDLKPEDIQPYQKDSPLYKTYTSERDKHIVFTPRLRQLADSLTQGTDNPLLKARKIFTWINAHFPWASAREYSTIANIPEYVLENHHGDCGQVTLLFLTLCRISGIPAHFESGFMMHPQYENLHDWGELYFEGVGWVPADMSFGIPCYAKNDKETYFFLGGIDSWRLVVNSDFGMPLYPEKTYPRSETVDFQRGEVEWKGGNVYFDNWHWKLSVIKSTN